MVRYLLRHPEPADIEGLCYGRLEVALKPGWQDAIGRAGHRLNASAPGITRIVTSPAQRCIEPAHWLGERLRVPVVSDARLLELDFGIWEGRRWDAIDGPECRAWTGDFVNGAPPGGERFAALAARVRAARVDWEQQGGCSLFLCHGGPIRALVAEHHHLPLAQAFSMTLAFAELVELSPGPV
ncbi:MAG: histidine phosphatase family protein [Gammaproteobacteria bacterium]|nr:histidine phosphatase family protein [Gammaproteobacteria bacterium]